MFGEEMKAALEKLERIARSSERAAAAQEKIAEAIVAPGDVELLARTNKPAKPVKK